MALIVNTRQFELSDELREYVEKKVAHLTHLLGHQEVQKVEVVLEKKSYKNKDRDYSCQITMWLVGKTVLRVEELDASAHASVDEAVDRLGVQISRYKGKLQAKIRKTKHFVREMEESLLPVDDDGGQVEVEEQGVPVVSVAEESEDVGLPPRIALPESHEIKKTKRFPIRVLDVDSAIEQMELLSHDFFLFVKEDTGRIAVVYRRNTETATDGIEYGLLEPEWA